MRHADTYCYRGEYATVQRPSGEMETVAMCGEQFLWFNGGNIGYVKTRVWLPAKQQTQSGLTSVLWLHWLTGAFCQAVGPSYVHGILSRPGQLQQQLGLWSSG